MVCHNRIDASAIPSSSATRSFWSWRARLVGIEGSLGAVDLETWRTACLRLFRPIANFARRASRKRDLRLWIRQSDRSWLLEPELEESAWAAEPLRFPSS